MRVSYIELAKLNGDKPLFAGEKIKVPNIRLYKVVKGDNIHRISNKLKIPVKDIAKINRNVSFLKVGQLLKIPNSKPKSGENFIDQNEKKASSSQKLKSEEIDFIWPASGTLIFKYEIYDEIMHYGLRLKLKKNKILSMESGVVSFLGKVRGLGMTLIISHEGGTSSLYGGLKKSIKEKGDRVNRGDWVATGDNILFFSIYEKGSPVDPILVMK